MNNASVKTGLPATLVVVELLPMVKNVLFSLTPFMITVQLYVPPLLCLTVTPISTTDGMVNCLTSRDKSCSGTVTGSPSTVQFTSVGGPWVELNDSMNTGGSASLDETRENCMLGSSIGPAVQEQQTLITHYVLATNHLLSSLYVPVLYTPTNNV